MILGDWWVWKGTSFSFIVYPLFLVPLNEETNIWWIARIKTVPRKFSKALLVQARQSCIVAGF